MSISQSVSQSVNQSVSHTLGHAIWPILDVIILIVVFLDSLALPPGVFSHFFKILIFGPFWAEKGFRGIKIKVFRIGSYHISLEMKLSADSELY